MTLTRLSAAGCAAAALALAAVPAVTAWPASAATIPPGQSVSLGLAPGSKTQQVLVLSVAPEPGATAEQNAPVESATYRLSTAAHPLKLSDCGDTLAADPGTRAFTSRAQSPAFEVTVPLPLGIFLICNYTAGYRSGEDPHSTAAADQGLSGQTLIGTSAPAMAPTAVYFNGGYVGARYELLGATANATSGVVLVQGQVGTAWRTLSKVRVTKGRWRALLTVHRGEALRAVLLPTASYKGSTSKVVRVR